ncbi:Hypothetical protein PHPALM_3656 [Phytophthora palmivora]|uniref:Uncharacterized protein n=1 Tax=Phytophthora palmivora TaxID=4796 RepID=A0A2P4YLU1_9STRA|nr:Hypothetical protein PHPALM_3656 [Phytophthora palmivora]
MRQFAVSHNKVVKLAAENRGRAMLKYQVVSGGDCRFEVTRRRSQGQTRDGYFITHCNLVHNWCTGRSRLIAQVGERISQDMSDAFGLMFDRWTCGTHHIVAIYGVFTKDDKLQQFLLAVSPTEFGQTADAHIEMIDMILNLYHRDGEMVLFIVADNCTTNQATRLCVPLVGCVWCWVLTVR